MENHTSSHYDITSKIADCTGRCIHTSEKLKSLTTKQEYEITGWYDDGYELWVRPVCTSDETAPSFPIHSGDSFKIIS